MKCTAIRFTLPSTGGRWNWPIGGEDCIAAFVEILDRANIAWTMGGTTPQALQSARNTHTTEEEPVMPYEPTTPANDHPEGPMGE